MPSGSPCEICGEVHAPGATCVGRKARKRPPEPAAAVDPDGSPKGSLPAGALLDGRFRVESLLEEGGMGEVYRGVYEELGMPVAIKRIRSPLGGLSEVTRRFVAEARHTACVEHPGVVKVLFLGSDPTAGPFFVMELLRGETLRARLLRERRLSVLRALDLIRRVLNVLVAVHEKGVIHRDLKPSNIMLVPDEETGERIKLLDFGIAKALDSASADLTGEGRALGTPAYMAPEVRLGLAKGADPRADVYAVGVILHQLLAGQLPSPPVIDATTSRPSGAQAARPIREIVGEIPAELDAIVAKAMAVDPKERFASAAEFRAALADLARPRSLLPGTLISDTYRVERKLGEGGMGAVYLVFDERMQRRFAIKLFTLDAAEDPGGRLRRRFERDGQLAHSIHHVALAHVHAQGVWQGIPYLVMEWVDGRTLREAWAKMTWPQLVAVVQQIAAALHELHAAGVVHRDVSPENILVRENAPAKLIDLGIARVDTSDLTRSELDYPLGRPGYMSREQLESARTVVPADDQWSLAAVVYEAVCGATPYCAANTDAAPPTLDALDAYSEALRTGTPPAAPSSLNPTVPSSLDLVLQRALGPREWRFPSVTAFASAVATARPPGVLLAVAAGDPPRSAQRDPPVRTRRRLAVALSAAVLVAGSTVGIALWSQQPSRGAASDATPPEPQAAVAPPGADARPELELATIVVSGSPSDAVVVVGSERHALPWTVTGPRGEILDLVVACPGYEAQDLRLEFGISPATAVVTLRPTVASPATVKKPETPPAPPATDRNRFRRRTMILEPGAGAAGP